MIEGPRTNLQREESWDEIVSTRHGPDLMGCFIGWPVLNISSQGADGVDDLVNYHLKELRCSTSSVTLKKAEGTDKLPVIIAKDLKDEEKAALIKVLKSYKRALAWKLSDIKGINPKFCIQKILMEDDFKPAVQHQSRVNPKIHEVTFKFPSTLKIKKRPHSCVLMERSPTVACLSAYAMHRARSKGV
ncbi:hypothetical protein Tco_1059523 [Tanacetum coccineum]